MVSTSVLREATASYYRTGVWMNFKYVDWRLQITIRAFWRPVMMASGGCRWCRQRNKIDNFFDTHRLNKARYV